MTHEEDEEFHAFVAARWGRLLRTAFLLTGHQQDAEDLVQSTLTRAFDRWGRVRRADDPEAYVWRMLLNAATDRLRAPRRLRERLTTHLPERGTADHSEELAVRDVLLEALALLSSRQRAVVVLRYLEGRTETEAALLLGTTVGTVRSHTARALATLRGNPALRDLTDQRGVAQ
ncbi:SigE family RNA polymerase sigma factor [Streptomyces hoynatensis]|uniref:SigE family RNA polymerase sigma factor n=1 Tax=Streptomyces hoynatensis TaxID=1141874 RepID=UPI001F4D4AA0|nr:SigE family RNA polymerase sigma factor [Streptomyces hoynatensis]